MSDDRPLIDKVQSWLNGSGYPLEFRTARAFEEAGFSVLHGVHVTDDAHGKRREVDVLADVRATVEVPSQVNTAAARVTLDISNVVECKNNAKPWVLFGDPPRTPMDERDILSDITFSLTCCMGSTLASAALWQIAANGPGVDLGIFRGAPYAAHAGTTYFGDRRGREDRKDEFFEAVQKLVSVAAPMQQDNFSDTFWVLPPTATVVLPVLVVTAPLFFAYLPEGSEVLTVEDVKWVSLLWSGSQVRELVPNIEVVHVEHLDAFVRQRAADSRRLLDQMSPAIRNIAETFQTRSLASLDVPVEWKCPKKLPYLLNNHRFFRNPEHDARTQTS